MFWIESELQDKPFREYLVGGLRYIGHQKDEPFRLCFKNESAARVAVRLHADGTDVLTGTRATLSPEGRMFIVEAYGVLRIKAMVETNQGGAQLLFTDADMGLSRWSHGDTSAVGVLGAASFVETRPFREPPSGSCIRYGGNPLVALRGGDFASLSVSNTRSSSGSDISYTSSPMTKSAVGLGEQVAQQLNSVAPLSAPGFSHAWSVRYLPAEQLATMVAATGPDNHGFQPEELAKGAVSRVPRVVGAKTVPMYR